MRTSVTVLAVSVVVGVATTAAGPAFADGLGEVATSTFSYSSVEAQENTDVVEEPDFQLQESAPATPLPVEPPRTDEAVAEDLAKPTTNIWSTRWLWVLGGLSLLWWAWLGWSARKNPAAQGM